MAHAEKQRTKQRRPGGITGKGFTPGDPRINRTRPGPGRPSLAFREALASLEPEALRVLEEALHARQWSVRLGAARDVLDRLHGKAGQPLPGGTNTLEDLLALAREDDGNPKPVLVIGGDSASYIDGLRRARGVFGVSSKPALLPPDRSSNGASGESEET
jgi:hypothetical protein